MAAVRPLGLNVAPLRLSVERALALLLATTLVAAARVAAADDVFRYCTGSEHDRFGSLQYQMTPIERPAPMFRKSPNKPLKGLVNALLHLRDDGYVQDVCILEARPVGAFEQMAVEALRRWRFARGDVTTMPRHRRWRVEIEFDLDVPER
jgi:outer membrane biosynthesis protein TonB